jgi:hypothetical protein
LVEGLQRRGGPRQFCGREFAVAIVIEGGDELRQTGLDPRAGKSGWVGRGLLGSGAGDERAEKAAGQQGEFWFHGLVS